MAHIVQVGAGSGGMVVLDLLARDPRVTAITLIEPDVYKSHNVVRHYFDAADVGALKIDLAHRWLVARRPDLQVQRIPHDLGHEQARGRIADALAQADVGVCAVDNEPAKYLWDQLCRQARVPWTLGEVLSGGIGGFVHAFVPDGPCYGCVASHLKREVAVEKPPVPDYSQPGGAVPEVTVPAPAAAIHAIASLHAVWTLRFLDPGVEPKPASTLLTLQAVPEVFPEADRTYALRIPRMDTCLFCRPTTAAPEDLDAALEAALTRLGHA